MTYWTPQLRQIIEFQTGDDRWALGRTLSSRKTGEDVLWTVRPLGGFALLEVSVDQIRVVRKLTTR